MRVFLDDEPLEVPGTTLRAAFDRAIEAASDRGRVIVEVTSDGEPLPDEHLDAPPDDRAWTAEVRFVSEDPREMATEALREASAGLEDARSHQRVAADAVLEGRLGEVRERIEPAIGMWQAVVATLENVGALLGLSLEELELDAPVGSVSARVSQLNESLMELHRAVMREDWSALGDILQYDLDERCEEWRALLGEVAARVERGGR